MAPKIVDNTKSNRCLKPVRGKKILEQLSRPRFFPGFEISRAFSTCLARRKAREISKPGKNQVLESYSNIFFPLDGAT